MVRAVGSMASLGMGLSQQIVVAQGAPRCGGGNQMELGSSIARMHSLRSGLKTGRVGVGESGMRSQRKRTALAMTKCCGEEDRFVAGGWRIAENRGIGERTGSAEEMEEVGLGVGDGEKVMMAEDSWGIGVDSLVQGEVGRMAVLATLLLGVGMGCLTSAGDAEAATAHMRNGALDVDMRALALGPEGPLMEEFWDNMRRYGLYFLTVASGGVYSLVKPIVDALKNPVTAVLSVVVVTGTIYLVGLTVSAMLGINEYHYEYAP